MNAKTLEAITKHGQNLLAIFPEAIERDPVALCKKLRRIETQGNRMMVDNCNGLVSEAEHEANHEILFVRTCKVLGLKPGNDKRDWLKINGDPRGYTLKIRDHVMRNHKLTLHADWGGYGILAPDLTA